MKALQITPIAGGWVITELPLSDYVSLSEIVAIREELGKSYEYPHGEKTVLGFVRAYLENQQKANTPSEPT